MTASIVIWMLLVVNKSTLFTPTAKLNQLVYEAKEKRADVRSDVEFLLWYGADPLKKDRFDSSAMEKASRFGLYDLIELFQQDLSKEKKIMLYQELTTAERSYSNYKLFKSFKLNRKNINQSSLDLTLGITTRIYYIDHHTIQINICSAKQGYRIIANSFEQELPIGLEYKVEGNDWFSGDTHKPEQVDEKDLAYGCFSKKYSIESILTKIRALNDSDARFKLRLPLYQDNALEFSTYYESDWLQQMTRNEEIQE